MLLQDFVYVDRSADSVVARLRDDSGDWLSTFAQAARLDGDDLNIGISPALFAAGPDRVVTVVCSEPMQRGDVTVVPLTWQSGGSGGGFATLDGDLEVAALGPRRCQVTLAGRYQPSPGAIAGRIDQLLLHRVAQASVRGFLGRMAHSLEEQAQGAAPHGGDRRRAQRRRCADGAR